MKHITDKEKLKVEQEYNEYLKHNDVDLRTLVTAEALQQEKLKEKSKRRKSRIAKRKEKEKQVLSGFGHSIIDSTIEYSLSEYRKGTDLKEYKEPSYVKVYRHTLILDEFYTDLEDEDIYEGQELFTIERVNSTRGEMLFVTKSREVRVAEFLDRNKNELFYLELPLDIRPFVPEDEEGIHEWETAKWYFEKAYDTTLEEEFEKEHPIISKETRKVKTIVDERKYRLYKDLQRKSNVHSKKETVVKTRKNEKQVLREALQLGVDTVDAEEKLLELREKDKAEYVY